MKILIEIYYFIFITAAKRRQREARDRLERLKKENDKYYTRLKDEEKKNDELEIKRESIQKQADIQRQQLLDKIKNIESLLSTEKDNREKWINQFEQEQSNHVKTNSELLKIRGELQDAQMNLRNA